MDRELADIFEDIVDLQPEEQRVILDSRCAGQPAWRMRIERWLKNDRANLDEHSTTHQTRVLTESLAARANGMHGNVNGGGDRGVNRLGDHVAKGGDSPGLVSQPAGVSVGTRIGRYQLTRKLDEGGMGVVYVAHHDELDRRAVVKVLRPELARRQDIVQRFRGEALAAASIRHPGIVDVTDVGSLDDGRLFIMMEHLEGETLRQRLRRTDAMGPSVAVALVKQIARALAAAHDRGIVHRDLKPSNIFLVADPEIPGGVRTKLLDFGIAKLGVSREISSCPEPARGPQGLAIPGPDDPAMPDPGDPAQALRSTPNEPRSDVLTLAHTAMGTPPYMPPEQFFDAADVDHRADLYALGIVLYEMVCGKPPFMRKDLGRYIQAHATEAPTPVRQIRPDVPEAVAAVIHRLLEKDRGQRYHSAQALLADLDQATTTSQSDITLPPPSGNPTDNPSGPSVRPVRSVPPLCTTGRWARHRRQETKRRRRCTGRPSAR